MWLTNVLKLTVLWCAQNLDWLFMVALLVVAYQIGYANGMLAGVEMVDEALKEIAQ